MLSYSANESTVAASEFKKPYWLFEFTSPATYNWSTKAVPDSVYNSTAYSFKIIPKTFTGIDLQRNKSEEGMFAPSSTSFSVTNKSNALDAADFIGVLVTIRLVVNNATYTETLGTWIFNVEECNSIHEVLEFQCVDPITFIIEGDYPNNRLVSTIKPSESDPQDDLCLPEVFGTAYIPLRSQLLGDSSDADRYYFLGDSTRTFTINEVRTPRDVGAGKSTWSSGNYSFNQSIATVGSNSYRVFQAIIADSDKDETPDANGVWFTGGSGMADMPTKFSRTDGVHPLSNPADVIAYVLEDMGISSSIIDTGGSFATAAATYTSWTLTFNGGFYEKISRERTLAALLNMCHSTLQITDKIELHVQTVTSRATISTSEVLRQGNTGYGTFSSSKLTKEESDAGHISFQPNTNSGESQDKLIKYTVAAKTTMNSISDHNYDLPFVADSQDVQKIGALLYQLKFLQNKSMAFRSKGTLMRLQPSDFVTINSAQYGGTYLALLDGVNISHDLSIRFNAISFSDTMDDWGDISPVGFTVVPDDTSNSWQTLNIGPDTTVDYGIIPNSLQGRFIIGDYDYGFITLDPDDVRISLNENGSGGLINRLNIGWLSEDNYGIEVLDASENPLISIDTDSALIAGWSIDPNGLYTTDSGGTVMEINATDGYVSINNSIFTNSGFQVQYNDGVPRLYIGDGADVYLKYENGSLDISGNISATTGTIGGFTISATQIYSGTDIVIDSADKYIAINDTTFGNLGFQVQYNSGSPRLYVGDGSDNYLKYEDGAIIISGVTITLPEIDPGIWACSGSALTVVAPPAPDASWGFALNSSNSPYIATYKDSNANLTVYSFSGSWSYEDTLFYRTPGLGQWYLSGAVPIKIRPNNKYGVMYYVQKTDYNDPLPNTYDSELRFATNQGGLDIDIVDANYNKSADEYSYGFDLMIDSNNYVHMVYMRRYTFTGPFSFRYATNATGSWVVRELSTIQATGKLLEHSDGDIIIVYSDHTNQQLKRLKGSGGSWSLSYLESTIPIPSSSAGMIEAAIDKDDTLHIAWQIANKYLFYYEDSSGTEIWVEPTANRLKGFSITVDSNDTVIIGLAKYEFGESVVELNFRKKRYGESLGEWVPVGTSLFANYTGGFTAIGSDGKLYVQIYMYEPDHLPYPSYDQVIGTVA